jgi:hypothetical protein
MAELSGGEELGRLSLQQRVSHLLYTAADYPGALHEARQVYDGLCRWGCNGAQGVGALEAEALGFWDGTRGMCHSLRPGAHRPGCAGRAVNSWGPIMHGGGGPACQLAGVGLPQLRQRTIAEAWHVAGKTPSSKCAY